MDPDIDTDPAIMRAGWWGARFYELLLKVSAKKDLKGRVPVEFQDFGWLARMWNLQPDDLEAMGLTELGVAATMARAQDAATRAGLILVDGEGAWVLKGWEKYYRPGKPAKQRTAEYEERQREKGLTRVDGRWISSRAGADPHDPHKTHDTPPTPPTHTTPPTHVDSAGERSGNHVVAVPEKPTVPDDEWTCDHFEDYAQAKRFEEGLPPEGGRSRVPKSSLAAWWSSLAMAGFTPREARLGFVAFGNDPYWKGQGLPLRGFLSQWTKYVRKELVARAG